MSRVAAALCLITAAGFPSGAQSLQDQLSKAPPEVEQRLRERISTFYQMHVDRKFRQAEQLVAEDTKDYFFERKKTTILKFEIKDIQYSDSFTKAKATVIAEQHVMLPGFAGKPMGIPVPSYWKVENGDWFYYVDQQSGAETPFGTMKAPSADPKGQNIDVAAAVKAAPDVDAIQKGVRADKEKLALGPGQPDGEVTISNLLPGKVTLSLQVPPVPGIKASLERTELSGKEMTTLAVKVDPSKPISQPVLIRVIAQPMNKVMFVLVSYEKSPN